VARFLGSTRGLELLSRRSVLDVPTTAVGADGLDGWVLAADPSGRPVWWMRGGASDADQVLVEPVGPDGSLRDLLGSALVSPVNAAVRVDADGRLVGLVPYAALEEHVLRAPSAPALVSAR
jgi:hypothetical protein